MLYKIGENWTGTKSRVYYGYDKSGKLLSFGDYEWYAYEHDLPIKVLWGVGDDWCIDYDQGNGFKRVGVWL